jgi:UDP-glucose 4-epimerase
MRLGRLPPLILIGGHGFLGAAYAAHSEAAGREVYRVGRGVSANRGNRDWSWDDGEAIRQAMDGRAPVIIDFAYATVPSTSFGDPVGDFTANLGAIIRHLNFANEIRASAYVFISSGGTVYGDASSLPLSEDCPTNPISPYGITKLACEHYALMYRRLGVPVLIARPSNIYGPGQLARRGQGMIAAAFSAAMEGRPLTLFGDGTQLRDYLHIDDFCTAVESILDRGEVGVTYNVGSGVGVRTDELIKAIQAIVAFDGRMLDVVHEERRPFDVDQNVLDIRRLAAATGWNATIALADGLRDTWRWALAR